MQLDALAQYLYYTYLYMCVHTKLYLVNINIIHTLYIGLIPLRIDYLFTIELKATHIKDISTITEIDAK